MKVPNVSIAETKTKMVRALSVWTSMRKTCHAVAIAALGIAASGTMGAASLIAPDLTVGSNLQTFATIRLSEPAPAGGIDITLTSEDAAHVMLSKRPDGPGSASIVLSVKAGFRESPEFCVYGFGGEGQVSYTASAERLGEGTGRVTVTPSAISVLGPFKAPKFATTSQAPTTKLTLYTVRLDGSSKVAEQQLLAGGLSVDIELTSSDPKVGDLVTSSVTIKGGAAVGTAEFKPAAPGQTTITASVPPGFGHPAEYASVVAEVSMPRLGLIDEVMIGENLQIAGLVGLGQAAPAGGVKVTVNSSDPARLLLAAAATEVGTSTVTVTIPAGGVNAKFYLQALGKSGTVEYSASASGYQARTSKVDLAPSGILLTPSPYGPPDEAEIMRADALDGPRGYIVSLRQHVKSTVPLVVWTAHLHPETLRGADITVQPLRAGMSLKLEVSSSDPAVGTIKSPVIIAGGSDHAGAFFKPLRVGSTTIGVNTPPKFTTPSNSTTLATTVLK